MSVGSYGSYSLPFMVKVINFVSGTRKFMASLILVFFVLVWPEPTLAFKVLLWSFLCNLIYHFEEVTVLATWSQQ
jgi:hypothetical protein